VKFIEERDEEINWNAVHFNGQWSLKSTHEEGVSYCGKHSTLFL